jgi:hypothetical protein
VEDTLPQQVQNGSYLAQKGWGPSVTLYTETMCVCPHLYGTDENSAIVIEDRQDAKDVGRASQIQFWYGDRFRGAALAPKALGATPFGSETGPRPIYSQTMNMQAMELASCSLLNTEVGQTYTNVPLEQKELHDCGAEAAELICRSIYYHLSGVTAYNAAGTKGWTLSPCGNDVTEMDAAHRFFMKSGATLDSDVAGDANSILTVEGVEQIITKLQSRASGVNSPFVPAKTPWGEFFILLVDSEGNEQLTRHSATTRYTSVTLSELNGGQALEKVASFMRANQGFQSTRQVLVIVDDYVPFGQTGTTAGLATSGTQVGNVRRAMLIGAKGMHLKWGEGFDAGSGAGTGSHIKATKHEVYTQTGWKFYTHWGGVATIPTSDPAPQRMGTATISYYVTASTPIY